ncbi:MAG: glycine cleavage T C-terminal barrel domain-containing protein [Phycisphaerales bacterium]
MLHASPLRDRHDRHAADEAARSPVLSAGERPGAGTGHRQAIEVEYLPYAAMGEAPTCELVAAYGPVEPEYAAIRRGAALFDAPQIGCVEVTGGERRAFLQRMLTQDLGGLDASRAVRSFWLNRKGRIDADLVVAEVGDRTLILVEVGRAASVAASLATFVFSEDVAIADRSSEFHWLELHGPAAGRGLALCGASTIPGRGECARATIAGEPVTLVRDDSLGENGWLIGAARERVGSVWDALVAATDPHDAKRRVRPIGWHAYNIARVEAGTPRFLIDFGPANLPHETGVLSSRVSFKKGCYLGQEVVARMESLGKPKQVLVGLRPARDLLPVAEAQVFERQDDGSMGVQIGAVTSSTLAPMLGAAPIAFAMIRTASAAPGTIVLVNAEGEQCEASVAPLRSWPVATDAGASPS